MPSTNRLILLISSVFLFSSGNAAAASAQEVVFAAQTPAPAPLRLADLALDQLVPGAFDALAGFLVFDRHNVPAHNIAYYLPPQRIEIPQAEIPQAEGTTGPDASSAVAPQALPQADVPPPEAEQAGSAEQAETEHGETVQPAPTPPAATIDLPARLMVFEPFYAPEGRLRPFSDLTVDAAEYLAHALIEALLDLELRTPGSAVAGLASGETLFADLPIEVRQEALVEAYADFGAHVLSLANEIERRRLEAPTPERFCAVAERGIGLFALWNGAFERQAFPGSYYQSQGTEPGALAKERIYSAHSLPKATRLAFVRTVLRREWTGVAKSDLLASHCP